MACRRWCCASIAVLVAGLALQTDTWRRMYHEAVVADCWTAEPPPPPEDGGAANLSAVHVAYAGDATQFPGILHSMLSLSRQLQSPGSCTIHVIVSRDDMDGAQRLSSCFRGELASLPAAPAVLLHEMLPGTFDLQAAKQAPRRDLLKPQVFARNYLQEYLPSAPRVLWLDSDTIVRSDLAPLYRMRMSHAVAAAADQRNVQRHLREDFGLSASFNSGVLLLDLERWRSGDISRALEARSAPGHAAGPATGRSWTLTQQLAMNLELGESFDRLDFRWNVLGLGGSRLGVPRRCIREARVLHWNGQRKPWARDGAHWPHDELFAAHAPRTPCGELG